MAFVWSCETKQNLAWQSTRTFLSLEIYSFAGVLAFWERRDQLGMPDPRFLANGIFN